ncbi:FAD dependent oxidoreductase [Trinorchestia longiramus]|nr:FAD dependent oxidoreductase [Trinorchestia longiramus]
MGLNDCVVLGGTLEEGNWSTSVDAATTEMIIKRCTQLMPALKGATVLGSMVGLRPYRKSGVRLEEDCVVTASGRRVPVVHNYGHAGCGITLMWGCARDVADKITTIALKSSL